MSFIRKSAGVAFWLFSLSLTAAIVWDYVGAQGAIPCGLAVLAVVGSAIGSVAAHRHWDNGSKWLAGVCCLFCILGEAYLIPLEIGFWASQVQRRIDDRELAAARRKAKLSELKNLTAKSWDETIKGSDEIQAERAVELSKLVTYQNAKGIDGSTKTLGAWTKDCTDREHWAFRARHCDRYVELGVELAKAKGAEDARLEMRRDASRETSDSVSDPVAGNRWFARRVGLGVEAWSDLFMVSGVLLLGFFRDATLLLTFAGSGQKSGHGCHPDSALTLTSDTDSHGCHPDTDTDTCQGDMSDDRVTATDRQVCQNVSVTDRETLTPVSVKKATLTRTDTKNQRVSRRVSDSVSVKTATLTDDTDTPLSRGGNPDRRVSLTVVRGGDMSVTALTGSMTVAEIAKLKGVSERTIHRRLAAEKAAKTPSLHSAKSADSPKKGA